MRVHGLCDERPGRVPRDARQAVRDRALALLVLRSVLGVASEVAGQQGRVDLARLEQETQHALEAREVVLAHSGEVHGVPGRGHWADCPGESLCERGGERRNLQAGCRHEVCGDDAVTTTVSEDGHAAAAGEIPDEERLCDVDELAGGVHQLDAGGPARRLDRHELAHERSRVRAGCPRAGLAAPGREKDDRLPRLRRAQACARERPSVAEVLHVEADDPGRLMGDQVADDVGRLEVGLIAERGEARESEPDLGDEQAQLEREVPALGDQPDRAPRELAPPDVQLGARIEDAEAVRAQQHRAGVANPSRDLLLACPTGGPELAHPGRDPDDRPGACRQRLVHGRLEGGLRHGDDDELRRAGELAQGAPRRAPENLGAVSVDQVDVAATLAA